MIAELDQIHLGFIFNENEGFAEAYLNEVNVEARIRTMEVSDFVSPIATISEVRRKLVEMQQLKKVKLVKNFQIQSLLREKK